MKAKTWRQYYGYRPQTLADLARANDTDLKRQRETYHAWLINAGRVALSDTDIATAVAAAQQNLERTEKWLEECRIRLAVKRRSAPLRRDVLAAEIRAYDAKKALEQPEQLKRDAFDSKVRSYIESTRREPLISATIERESTVREEDFIGPLCSVRTIRCASATAKEHYGYPNWEQDSKLSWWKFGRDLPKFDAPTTYAVIVNGRCVNSFLSKARAKTWARAQMQEIAT